MRRDEGGTEDGGRHEIEWDDEALTGTYRRWRTDGELVEERPATDADLRLFPSFDRAWD